jgi:hypothetical protein
MSVEALKRILTPPERPMDAGAPEQWAAVEAAIGTPLPADYKEYIQTYGLGNIDHFITIYTPFTQYKYVNLVEQQKMKLDALRALQYEEIPFKLFPEMGGLLPVGITENGDVLYWITRGTPEHWPVAINEARGPEWEQLKLDITSVLAALVSRRIRCGVFPDEFPSANPSFVQPNFDGKRQPPKI